MKKKWLLCDGMEVLANTTVVINLQDMRIKRTHCTS